MILFPELQTKWNDTNRSQENYILVSGDHKLSFHIGYNAAHQKSFIVLNTGKVNDMPSSKAIVAKCIKSENNVFSIQFSLQYDSLEDVFMLLCWDLMDNSDVEFDPLKHLIERYSNWHKLLQKGSIALLSNIQIKGLIAELIFLREAMNLYGEEQALLGWVGPEGFDQDFIFADKWVEVKSVAISADGVTISSLQQLERYDLGELSIYFMDKSSANDVNACSLEDLVIKLENTFTTQKFKDKFWCKLMRCGCFKHQLSRYSEPKYRVAENRVYEVKEEFPRLVRSNVATEIMSARYTISLASIKKFQVAKD